MRITMSRTELPFLSMGSILLTGSVIRLPATERAYGIDIAALSRKTERWDQPTTTAMTRPASRGKVIADPGGEWRNAMEASHHLAIRSPRRARVAPAGFPVRRQFRLRPRRLCSTLEGR